MIYVSTGARDFESRDELLKCSFDFESLFCIQDLAFNKYYSISRAEPGEWLKTYIYIHENCLQLYPNTYEELVYLCNWGGNLHIIKQVILDVNSPLNSFIGKKFNFLIMNHWFKSCDYLLKFYNACLDYDPEKEKSWNFLERYKYLRGY